MNFQRIIIAGNLTGDAKYGKSKESETEYVRFSVAVRGYKKEQATYFPTTLFGDRAKPLSKYLKKGKQVLVEGRITTDDKRRFSVIAQHVELGARKSKKGNSAK